jgi:hypothetical protein
VYAFQRQVGCLLYATTITRPDAARAANKLSEFLQNPGPIHLEAANRAIAYLYSTRIRSIQYSASSWSRLSSVPVMLHTPMILSLDEAQPAMFSFSLVVQSTGIGWQPGTRFGLYRCTVQVDLDLT